MSESMTRRRVPERHAQARAAERYGLDVTMVEMRELEARLAAGEGMILRREPANGSSTQVIWFRGELVTLIYGRNGFVYTFLPKDAPFKRTGMRRRERGE